MIPISIVLWVHFIALPLWIGSVIFLLFFAKPGKKRSAYDHTKLGIVVSQIYKMLNGLKFVCWLLLLISAFQFFLHFDSGGGRISLDITLIAMMGFMTGIYSFVLSPRMERIRESVLTLDPKGPNHGSVLRYSGLHRIYVGLLALNLGLGLGTLFLSLQICGVL